MLKPAWQAHKDGDGGDKTAVKRKAYTEDTPSSSTTRKWAYDRGKFNLSQPEQQQHMFNITQERARRIFKKERKDE
jgi:hypothetical protein